MSSELELHCNTACCYVGIIRIVIKFVSKFTLKIMSIILKPWYTDNIILYTMISTGMSMVYTDGQRLVLLLVAKL